MITRRITPALMSFALILTACQGEEQTGEEVVGGDVAATVQMYPNASAPVVLENEIAIIQRTGGEPGTWTGEHPHAGNQLAVVLSGGTLTYREGGAERDVMYEDGQVFWVDAVESHDHTSKDQTVEAVLITMKELAAGMGAAQAYPEANADIAFENDYVVVQRLVSEPDTWVGEHSHPGNQLVVILTGGTVTYREGGEETEVTYEDGQVFQLEATEAHDHANTSGTQAVALLITPKA